MSRTEGKGGQMIVSNRKHAFGTIITLMRDGELDFAISTSKEGIFKGLT